MIRDEIHLKKHKTASGTIHYWIDDAGHNANTDRPEIVNNLIETFVKDNAVCEAEEK
ncbi:MAG: hypothetical protein ACOX1U_07360 [Saccharofermentanales bacterium]